MKLARIEHWRCGEADGSTLVWVPDAFSEEQLRELVKRAREECLRAEDEVDGTTVPPYQTYWNFIDKADHSKSLAVIKSEYAAHDAEYKAWCAKRDAARKSFSRRLKDLSKDKIVMFWDAEFPIDIECSWGHSHGKRVDYGAIKDLD